MPSIEIYGHNRYEYRAITPFDFLGGEIPLSYFRVATPKSQYEKMMHEMGESKDDSTKEIELLKTVLGVGVISENGYPFSVNDFFKREDPVALEIALKLFEIVIEASFLHRKIIKISESEGLTIDRLARRYAKSPAEIVWPSGGYSEMDAYTFNLAIAGIGISNQVGYVNKNKIQVVHTI